MPPKRCPGQQNTWRDPDLAAPRGREAAVTTKSLGLTADEWLPDDRSVPAATDNTSPVTLA